MRIISWIPKLLITLSILIISNNIVAQVKDNRILSFAELYGSIRFFYPNDIPENEWWKFLDYGINEIEKTNKNDLHLFSSLFSPVCPQIKFSNENILNLHIQNPIDTPIYWQHRSYGPKNSIYYKSILVNYDKIGLLDNGINFSRKIESKNDSIEVAIQFTDLTNPLMINFRLSLYSWGWLNGIQKEKKGEIQYDSLRDLYYLRLSERTENIYFKFFLETLPSTHTIIDKIYVLSQSRPKRLKSFKNRERI